MAKDNVLNEQLINDLLLKKPRCILSIENKIENTLIFYRKFGG